jgi:hypothetical protein
MPLKTALMPEMLGSSAFQSVIAGWVCLATQPGNKKSAEQRLDAETCYHL